MYKPEKDWVIIEPIAEENITTSGIVLQEDNKKQRARKAKVLEVGPGRKYPYQDENGHIHLVFDPTVVKPGDTVLYLPHGQLEFYHNGKDHVWISEGNIIGMLTQPRDSANAEITGKSKIILSDIDYDTRS